MEARNAYKILVRILFDCGHLEDNEENKRTTSDKNGRYPVTDFAIITDKPSGLAIRNVISSLCLTHMRLLSGIFYGI
jgi:hypothetical protein